MSLRAPSALLAAAAAAALAVAGCGGGSGSSSGSATAASPAPAKDGGTLHVAINANQSWDPVTSAAGNEVRHLGLVYEALTHINQQGDPTPGLATAWKYSADGKTLTFTLRSGATFSDGSKLDATLVKRNLERAQQQTGSVLTQLLSTVESIDAVDPETVRLNLTQADYGLPLVLGGKAGMIVSGPALDAGVSKLPRAPVGAGPFILKKFVPDGSAALVKNPSYWDAKDIHLDGVDLQYLTDPQAVLAGLQSGTIDLAVSSGDQVAAAKRDGLNVNQFPSLSLASIEINDAQKPYTDHRVVEAINYALDRPALIATQNGGIGEPSYQPFPKGYVGYSDEVGDLYPHDPAKAKALLARAGYPKGLQIDITYFDYANYKALTEQIQAQLAAVGISSKLKSIPLAQGAELVYVKHSVGFNPNGIVGRESPVQMLNVQYGAEGLLNPGRRASPELTAALATAATHPLDSPEYPKALQAATALAAKQSAVAFLYTTPTIILTTKKVTGLEGYISTIRFDGVRVGG